MSKNDYVNLTEEDNKPKDVYGVWTSQKYLGGCENLRVSQGITISVKPTGGNDYEVNIVGVKSNIIADNIDEAKNQAKIMLYDKLTNALEFAK
jgi:hypothetical protein